jgi:hypothetical protein
MGFVFTVTVTAAAAAGDSTLSLLSQYQQICRDDYNSELEVSEDAVYDLLVGRELINRHSPSGMLADVKIT